jgi:hypothetical protein
MNSEQIVETSDFEIVELEYDVGGAGAVETADSQVNHAAWVLAFVTPR